MLPFGSITSIIPLSVLAIAYALFICASALNRIKPASDTLQVKEIFVKADSGDHSDQSAVKYSEIQHYTACRISNETYKSPEWVYFTLIDFPPRPAYSGYAKFMFSRPPPALFS